MLLPGLTALYDLATSSISRASKTNRTVIGCFCALIVNCLCTLILIRFKNFSGSLTRGAFLSARNDALANLIIIFTGIITYYYSSIWPDIIVGIFIAYIRTESALEIFNRAMKELKLSKNNL